MSLIKKLVVGVVIGLAALIVAAEVGLFSLTFGFTQDLKEGGFFGNMPLSYPLYERPEIEKHNPDIPILDLSSHADLALQFEETELNEIPKPNMPGEEDENPERFNREIRPSSFQGILIRESLPNTLDVRNRIFYKEIVLKNPIQYRWESRSFLANDKRVYQLDLSGTDEVSGSLKIYGFISKDKAGKAFRDVIQRTQHAELEKEVRQTLQEVHEGQHDQNLGTYLRDLEELSNPPTEDEVYQLRDLIREGKLDKLKELYAKKPEMLSWRNSVPKNLPFHTAARHDQLGVCKWLVGQGAGLEEVNIFRQTALQTAAIHGKKTEILEYLLAQGAKLESRDRDGRTPLHNAAHFSQPLAIKVLLEAGAEHSVVDLEGMTPLALAFEDDELEIAELLLKSGATAAEPKNREGKSPSDFANTPKEQELLKRFKSAQ